MTTFWDRISGHLENPVMGHMKSFVEDLIGSLQNFESHVLGRLRSQEQGFDERITAEFARMQAVVSGYKTEIENFIKEKEAQLSQVTDALTGAVSDLMAKLADHDTAINAAVEKLTAGVNAGDMSAVSAAADAIKQATSKIAGETQVINDQLKAANPAPATGTDPTKAADPATGTTA